MLQAEKNQPQKPFQKSEIPFMNLENHCAKLILNEIKYQWAVRRVNEYQYERCNRNSRNDRE